MTHIFREKPNRDKFPPNTISTTDSPFSPYIIEYGVNLKTETITIDGTPTRIRLWNDNSNLTGWKPELHYSTCPRTVHPDDALTEFSKLVDQSKANKEQMNKLLSQLLASFAHGAPVNTLRNTAPSITTHQAASLTPTFPVT